MFPAQISTPAFQVSINEVSVGSGVEGKSQRVSGAGEVKGARKRYVQVGESTNASKQHKRASSRSWVATISTLGAPGGA